MLGRKTSTRLPALMVVFANGLASAPAAASMPSFSQTEKIVGTDGRQLEMLVLRDDGILFADRLMLAILDMEGRLLARSRQSRAMTIVCDERPRSCWGFDHDRRQVLRPEPSGFRIGGPDLPGRLERETGATELDRPEDSWGIESRAPTFGESARAELAMARCHLGSLIVLTLTGWVFAACIAAVGLPRDRRAIGLAIWIGKGALMLTGAALAVLFVVYLLILVNISETLWLMGFALGLAPFVIFRWLSGRRRAASAA